MLSGHATRGVDVPALDRKKGYEFAPGKIKVGEAPHKLCKFPSDSISRVLHDQDLLISMANAD